MSTNKVSTYEQRQEWKARQLYSDNGFIQEMPKVELHVHIEGTMTPELRWKLACRNGISLTAGSQKIPLASLDATREAYKHIRGRIGAASADASKNMTFFEAYYGGFDLLQAEEDYYELAMNYFEHAARMNLRYCEPFFDAQGHTRRGISMETIMGGFRRAQLYAEEHLKVWSNLKRTTSPPTNKWQIKSQWIMCFLRDMSEESAMIQYEAALPFKEMIVGIGLDSDEYDRPPLLFDAVYKRARADGFKLTSHCDFNQKDTHENIRQVSEALGGSGADRIDHGMNVADRDDLIDQIKKSGIPLTICPCAYIRHTSEIEIFPRIRKLFDAGIKITIASDDPAYMEDNWVLHNMHMVRDKCKFTDAEMVQLQRNAVDACWAPDRVKQALLEEIKKFESSH